MIPQPTIDELAGRLGVPPAATVRLADCIAAAVAMLEPRVDPSKAARLPETSREAILQLAVKIWETGARGTGEGFGAAGEYYTSPPTPSAGMWRSVAGLAQPILRTGGIVIG